MQKSWKRQSWTLFSILLSFAVRSSVAAAQEAKEQPAVGRSAVLDLAEVLTKLEDNLREYRSSVPDLYCKEHVVSSMEGRRIHKLTVADSVFRLRPVRDEMGFTEFAESREIKAVDGNSSINDAVSLSGPAVISGVFSDGLRVVSKELQGCFRYTLQPARQNNRHGLVMLEFSDLPEGERAAECPPFEGARGRAEIDPSTMHVLQLEKTSPDPDRPLSRTATWTWKVKYAPVQLQGKTFWMPRTVHSTTRTDDGMYEWNFEGTYKDYHLFHVESRIVPTSP